MPLEDELVDQDTIEIPNASAVTEASVNEDFVDIVSSPGQVLPGVGEKAVGTPTLRPPHAASQAKQ